jgi:hypothetical protein
MTQLTNPVELTNSNWTDLGAGPLSVAALGPEWPLISLIVSDQAPPLPAPPGEPLRDRRFFNTSSHVWGIAMADPKTVIVTAPDGGSAAEGTGFPPSGTSPVTSAFTAAGQSAAFIPLAGRPANISIWGTFAASLQLKRSFDGGTTLLPLTAAGVTLYAWTAPASESFEETESGVEYFLACTGYTSGTVNYRISQ